MSARLLHLILPLSLLAACEARERAGSSATTDGPVKLAAASAATPGLETTCARDPHPGCDPEQAAPTCGQATADGRAAAESEACSACGADGVALASDRIERGTDPATGRALERVGAPLGDAARVALPALLARPETFTGETIRVEGDVVAMCHHRRAWFALQEVGDRQGRTVRVIGAPAFLVPPDAVGRRARAEGVVELVDVPGRARAHLASDHGLQEPPPPERVVVLRATGAEFI